MNDKINLARQFSGFDETWSPRIVGELNGQLVKIAKIQGEFVWHHHDTEDEFFLVLRGRMRWTVLSPFRISSISAHFSMSVYTLDGPRRLRVALEPQEFPM